MFAEVFEVYSNTVLSSLTSVPELESRIRECVDRMRRLTVRVTTVRMSMQFTYEGQTYQVQFYPNSTTPV